jgi:hypothetical protein
MTDERFRAALLELADVPPPADLATAALTRARRDRRRVRIGLVVAVVAAVAAALVVPAALRGHPEAAPPASPAPAVWVPAYRTTDPDTPAYVYDAAGTRYRPVKDLLVVPSPDGRLALVQKIYTLRFAVVPIARPAAGLRESDWRAELAGQHWTWSPDSTRLLAQSGTLRSTRAEVFDVRNGTITRIPLQLGPLASADHEVEWAPTGGGFVAWQRAPFPHPSATVGSGQLLLLDATGRVTERRPMPQIDNIRWSPDGTRALLVRYDPAARSNSRYWLFDVRSARLVPTPAAADQWYDEQRLLRLDPGIGPTVQSDRPNEAVIIDAATGSVARRVRLPVPAMVGVGYIYLARGTPPPGAIVL